MARVKVNSETLTEAFTKRNNEIIAQDYQNVPNKLFTTVYRPHVTKTLNAVEIHSRDSSFPLTPNERTGTAPYNIITRKKNIARSSGRYNEGPFRFEASKSPIAVSSTGKDQLILSPQCASYMEDEKPSLTFDHTVKKPEVCAENIIAKKKRGRPRKFDPNIVINEILLRRTEIIKSKDCYVSRKNPVWKRIANALGNIISPSTVFIMANRKDVRMMIDKKIKVLSVNVRETRKHRIAERHEDREKIIIADEKKGITAGSTDNDCSRKKHEVIDLENVIDAIVTRKTEVVSPEGRDASQKHPVSSGIASNVGNGKAPMAERTVACHKDVCALDLLGDDEKNIRRAHAKDGASDTAGTDNIRNAMNEILLTIIDSGNRQINEIKELRKDLREEIQNLGKNLHAELQELRNDLRERKDNYFDLGYTSTLFH